VACPATPRQALTDAARFLAPAAHGGPGRMRTLSLPGDRARIAEATAVFTSTASAPISMQSAASEGEPSPASTTTGTRACSMMISI